MASKNKQAMVNGGPIHMGDFLRVEFEGDVVGRGVTYSRQFNASGNQHDTSRILLSGHWRLSGAGHMKGQQWPLPLRRGRGHGMV